jgi:hypothetical protein
MQQLEQELEEEMDEEGKKEEARDQPKMPYKPLSAFTVFLKEGDKGLSIKERARLWGELSSG